ncbi:MAG TPA: U32 family peptidase [Bryobacteraceae bacterium]|nr:U32 family peptidase [Bryobacteraceae bacterium]
MSRALRKPEVKSPAGHWPQLHAAIEAGADGVYFGLKHFSARAKTGFLLDELPEAVRTLHGRGVRGYVTFNTLIFEHELSEAARAIAAIAEAGADGIIAQDYAAVKLAREIAPNMEVHGSTQMSVTDARGVELAQRMGVARVTLARELSIDELRKIAAETDCDLEIFVHGALCVAYSGQCLSSEAWGGRSANRGQCAQACRLPYEMIVDGNIRPLADARYLLSPGDLYALHQIPELVAIGIAALKIEGRYKDAEYVALATKAYREAVDAVWAGQDFNIDKKDDLQLEQVYSRGLGPYFLTGTNHQAVVRGRAPRHRGVRMGVVVRAEGDRVVVRPDVLSNNAHRIAPMKAGDGVVFDAADWRSPEEPEEGGRVFETTARPDGTVELQFGSSNKKSGSIDARRIRPGDIVWRTHDPDVDRAARTFIQATSPVARQRVDVHVRAREGEPLIAEWTVRAHPTMHVRVDTAAALDAARDHGISVDVLRDQLGRLGGTPYELGEITLDIEGSPFAPMSALNQLRRKAVEQLQAAQTGPPAAGIHDPVQSLAHFMTPPRAQAEKSGDLGAARIHVLVRTPEQLEAVLDLAPASVTLDYLDLYGLRPSVERVKARGITARVASPRVLKPGESRILDFLLSLDCTILVRPAGLLDALQKKQHPPLIGDFSLNTANSVAADLFLAMGLDRITPAHDLNAEQVVELARHTGGDRMEVVAYQHLPVFHTEHCVFCRFLSTGTSFRDCGRPCEKHRVELKDPAGRSHPVVADVGCRNTVFGAEAQEASAHLDSWRRGGIRHWRLEFVHEDGDQVRQVFRAFERALAVGSARELASELKRIAPQGTTQGSLYIAPDYRTLPPIL